MPAMPLNPIIPRDGTILLGDGTGSPVLFTVAYEDGDLSLGGLVDGNDEQQVFMDRGIPYSIRKVAKKPIKFSLTAHAITFAHASTGNILDFLRRKNVYSANVSTLGSSGQLGDGMTFNMRFTAERSNFGDASDRYIELKYCMLEDNSFAEGLPGKFQLSGEAYILDSDQAASFVVA